MLYYFAPLEGITNALYRQVHRAHFPAMDKYFTPFFVPSATGLSSKDRRELLPERNEGISLVPQLLTNKSEDFLAAAAQMRQLGYKEVNLNLGCPSGTVVSKKRGAGLLAFPSDLRQFLDELFSGAEIGISIKTRIGMEHPSEFEALLEIYNAYPLTELIIHPRVRKDFYRNHPNLSSYQEALKNSRSPVVYSGDLFTPEGVFAFVQAYPSSMAVMLGRGLLANPGLGATVMGGAPLTKDRLLDFHQDLYLRYQEVLFGEKPVLHKIKELWHYMICLFPDHEKHAKLLRKSQTLGDYEAAVSAIFRDLTLSPETGYQP